jgi:hypothetical protein
VADWGDEIERVAAYLYRDDHDWHPAAVWSALDDTTRARYRKRADAVAAMLGFPYHAKVVAQLDRLCPCDPNPETTQGPEWNCPIHGQQPDAVIALAAAVRVADAAETLFPTQGTAYVSEEQHVEYVDHDALEGLRAALRTRAVLRPGCGYVPEDATVPCGQPATARWIDGATGEEHYTCAAHEEQAEPFYERRTLHEVTP